MSSRNRYWVFSWDRYDEPSGMNEYIDSFKNFTEACIFLRGFLLGKGNTQKGQVFDSEENEILLDNYFTTYDKST